MKIAVLIYAADFTVRKQNYMHSVKKGLLPMLLVMGLVGFLVLKEPDLGAYVMMLAISMGILFLGGINLTVFIMVLVGRSGAAGLHDLCGKLASGAFSLLTWILGKSRTLRARLISSPIR